MGVDFYGYSRVKAEPVPERFRAKRVPASAEKRRDLENRLRLAPYDVRCLILTLSGTSVGPEGQLIIPDDIEISEELRDEFYAMYRENKDFINVCWDTNIMYFKTADSKPGSAGRSYSGYGDFCTLLTKLNGGRPLSYMPPSTDTAPENGFVSAEKCLQCLQGLDLVRHHFVSAGFTADGGKYGESCDHRFKEDLVPKEDDIHGDSWFFREFYSLMTLGADGGIVRIS